MTPLTIVTAASDNHFNCLCNLLYSISVFEPAAKTIVYDLGLSASQAASLRKNRAIQLRLFEYDKYPAWIKVQGSGDRAARAGHYVWKPIIVHDTLAACDGIVLWLDAGNLVMRNLEQLREVLRQTGIYSPLSKADIQTWTHPKTLEYLQVGNHLLGKRNRNAAVVGLAAASSIAKELVATWKTRALARECIAPEGSSILNHRYDQALLTIIMYQLQETHGLKLTNELLGISVHNDRKSLEELKVLIRA